MALPKIRRWDDASAPVLDGLYGSLITVLDAVLVNGYGSQSSLGWTKEYSGTNKAAYRNNPTTGTGFYFRFDDSSAYAVQNVAQVKGYESMTGIDTGAGRFPNVDLLYHSKSSAASSVARPWIFYGDDRTFYMLTYYNYTTTGADNYASIYLYGDLISDVVGDSFFCVIGAGIHTTATYGSYWPYKQAFVAVPSVSYPLYVARPSDGTGEDGDNKVKVIWRQSGNLQPGVDGFQSGLWNNRLLYGNFGYVSDCAERTYRGRFPIIYEPLHDYAFMTDDVQHGDFMYHKARTHNVTGGILFNIAQDMRA